MLEINMDFAKKVAVPAVSNLRELGAVLHESRIFNSAEVNQTLDTIRQRTGSDSVGIGIKNVLDFIFEARAGGPDSDMSETFSELLVERFQEGTV